MNPALALAAMVRERKPDAEVLFVGANRGIERRLIEQAGWRFRSVEISSFHRSLRGREIRHNLISIKNLLSSPKEARAVLREFPADLVIGTGGYASYPMIRAASLQGIPTAVHESNAIPGLTTRLLERRADLIMVGFEACRQNYRHPEKVLVTGTPVRGDFFTYTRQEAKQRLGITDGRPVIVSFWGSLGAGEMNRRMVDFLRRERRERLFHHIHGAGVVGCQRMAESLRESGLSLEDTPELQVREYIHDMGLWMRAADLVICRAGASTISELTALGVPAIIVPSPHVANNHQEYNARVLAEAGGAEMVLEAESDGETLYRLAKEILTDSSRCQRMRDAMASLGTVDAAQKIYQAVMDLAARSKK